MKIAFILPSLSHKAPILVVRDIVDQIHDRVDTVDVYYFDDIVEVEFACPVHHIRFSDKIDFDKYDIIHSHLYRPDKYVWKNRKHFKGKSISTIHCNIAKDLHYSYNLLISLVFRWVWIYYLRSCDKIVALTQSAINDQYRKYFPASKLTYVYNGRTLTKVAPINREDEQKILDFKDRGLKIIGSNAILTKRKGLHLVVESLQKLPDYAFVVVGDGEEKANLIALATELNVLDRCLFLGFKTNATSYLPFFDVYAMPSFSEGFGLALIEATLTKRSCVCSDIDSFREMFSKDEVTFFSSSDTDSLQDAIEAAYHKRSEKGEAAYKRSKQRYTAEAMGKRYFELYKSILAD